MIKIDERKRRTRENQMYNWTGFISINYTRQKDVVDHDRWTFALQTLFSRPTTNQKKNMENEKVIKTTKLQFSCIPQISLPFFPPATTQQHTVQLLEYQNKENPTKNRYFCVSIFIFGEFCFLSGFFPLFSPNIGVVCRSIYAAFTEMNCS